MRRVSKKRAKINRIRRGVVQSVLADADYRCGINIRGVCLGRADHCHERLPRARGGSITDPSNLIPACFPCNQWCHANPVEAEKLGFLESGKESHAQTCNQN